MYHVSAQGVDERMINVHYIYIYESFYSGFLIALIKPIDFDSPILRIDLDHIAQ